MWSRNHRKKFMICEVVEMTTEKLKFNRQNIKNERSKAMIKGVKFQLEDLNTHTKKEIIYHFKKSIESKANAFGKFIDDFSLFASAICFSGEYEVVIDWDSIVMRKFSDDIKDIDYIGLYIKDKGLRRFFTCSNFEFICQH